MDQEQFELGKKMIEAAIKIDEALAEILKVEVKKMKKLMNTNCPSSLEEMNKINTIIKNIILALTMTEEKVRSGLALCKDKDKK